MSILNKNGVFLDEKIRKACLNQNIITPSEITWIVDTLRKNGSTIHRQVFLTVLYHNHFAPLKYQKEIEALEQYIVLKKSLIKKLNKFIKDDFSKDTLPTNN